MNKYELQKVLGKGSYGRVWEATNIQDGTQVSGNFDCRLFMSFPVKESLKTLLSIVYYVFLRLQSKNFTTKSAHGRSALSYQRFK
mmetsp:Transcript_23656/g.93369  ORF Transcript_23656/g.93369 Transcript_23656/m.93369 type:complete len:85 (-) Transcript_23656:1539-1793(-)